MLRNVGYLIGGVLLLVLIYYVLLALPFLLQDRPQVDKNSEDFLQQLGALGEYLGYIVGVPAAIGGALAAVAIALNTDSVARRQLQIEAAKYRDSKTDEIKTNLKDFAERLQAVRKTGAQLARRITRLRQHADTTTDLISLSAQDENVVESFDRLTEEFDSLSRSILSLASNEIVHACVEGQRTASRNKIREAVQGFWGNDTLFDFQRDILDIRDQLDFLQQDRTVEDAAAASLLMPPDYHTLDFLGAYIKIANRHDELGTDLLKQQSLREGDILINYGLALLASLYQLLPSDQMISDTITRLYKIRDVKLRPTSRFKAREVYFSRSTVEVVNQAIDGERLFLQVRSNDIVGGDGIGFHDASAPGARRTLVARMTGAMLRWSD